MKQFTKQGTLYPAAPYDFNKSAAFLQGFSPTKGEQATGSSEIVKAIKWQGQVFAFSLRSTGTLEHPRLVYTLFSTEAITDSQQRELEEKIRFVFSLDDELRPFYQLGSKDPVFQPIVERLYGYHQVKFLTPFENACWAVLSQRVPMPAAKSVKQELSRRYGGNVTIHNQPYPAFPEPADLLAADREEMLTIVGQQKKQEYLLAMSEAFQHVGDDFLQRGDYQQVRRFLLGIKGIGEWSASFILIRGLGRMEELPTGEGALERVYSRLYRRPAGTGWPDYGLWRGYWAHYLRASELFR
ncbi:hypothetical protein LOK74_05765 [Brevibacillus humidisoli]|uniref:DNA-3-methyladenine glycosylase family protein n=1 Tax=Brevibacillus humidisoli TaxID=2895522 RepID=UPI001E41FD85|nr:hypothetical protein [Brevibacillus humidisoli]UFJ42004.1 hypothetical protein LOK74_05765 [Brevibacillus humidisoli]